MQDSDSEKPIEKIQEAAQAAAHAETAPPRVRRYRAVLFQTGLLAVVVAFSVLALLVSTTAYFPIDLRITLDLQAIKSPLFAELMSLISWAGYTPQSILLTTLIVAVLFVFGLQWEALMGMATALFDEAVNTLVKIIVHRPRPSVNLVHVVATINSYSFPSGHVMFYTGFFGFIWFLIFTLLRKSWLRTLLLSIFSVLILLIGVSRIYLGEHWTSDVVGAYLLGSLVLVVSIQAYRWGKSRFFMHQPVAAEHKKA
jgi:membrane-associated phospholipid phosphatase